MQINADNSPNRLVKTYKVMPRSQNSHAYVNAGFNFLFQSAGSNELIVETSIIVFGGLSTKFVHAELTEKFLVGKSLKDDRVLTEAFEILNKELVIDDEDHVLSSKAYRRSLALSLLYKFVLYANKDDLSESLKSSTLDLFDCRQISCGVQELV